jgi:hypothetical protein
MADHAHAPAATLPLLVAVSCTAAALTGCAGMGSVPGCPDVSGTSAVGVA